MAIDRRRLLAGLTAAPAVAMAPRATAQQAQGQPLPGNPVLPEPMSERTRWAIVGLGTFAVGQIIPGFADARKSRITAFVSGNAAKAHTLGQRYGVTRLYDYAGYDRIAADPEIDCVYIACLLGCTPNTPSAP